MAAVCCCFNRFTAGRKFQIRRRLTCKTPNVIHLCTCKNCGKQGIGPTTEWKPRLANYKSHAKHNVNSFSTSKHFSTQFTSPIDTSAFYSFQLIDCLDNFENLSEEEVDDLLLDKEKFWIGTLLTMHKGLNNTHDWNRKKRRAVDDTLWRF